MKHNKTQRKKSQKKRSRRKKTHMKTKLERYKLLILEYKKK